MLQQCGCRCQVARLFKPDIQTFKSIIKRTASTRDYDIIISGGGMVGTATAAALGKEPLLKNHRILLIESEPEKLYKVPDTYSNRVSALSPASKKLLQDVGAWNRITTVRSHPVKSMYVWEACSDASISFDKSDVDTDGNLAYLVENDVTVAALSECVKECHSTVDVAFGTKVIRYEHPTSAGEMVNVHLDDDNVISARLVVGADGFKSLARTSANIKTCSWNYDQVGVVATLKLDITEEGGNHTAWQRFLPSGPIALLPLSNSVSSLVWSTTHDHGKKLLSLEPEQFVNELNEALHDCSQNNDLVSSIATPYSNLLKEILPGRCMKLSPPAVLAIETRSRAMFPYGLMNADRYISPRLALVGDACHRIHPLAGQGVNLGFGDTECLVRKVTEAVDRGADIGWTDHLMEYETERQRQVVPMLAGCDGLYRLYSNDLTPIVLARSLGLITVNAFSPVKDLFMKQAQS